MLSPYNIGVVHKSFTVKLGPVVPSIEIKSAQDVVVNVNVLKDFKNKSIDIKSQGSTSTWTLQWALCIPPRCSRWWGTQTFNMRDDDNGGGGGECWRKEVEGVGNDGSGNYEERYQPRGRIVCEEAKDIGERSPTNSKSHLSFSNQTCPFSLEHIWIRICISLHHDE